VEGGCATGYDAGVGVVFGGRRGGGGGGGGRRGGGVGFHFRVQVVLVQAKEVHNALPERSSFIVVVVVVIIIVLVVVFISPTLSRPLPRRSNNVNLHALLYHLPCLYVAL